MKWKFYSKENLPLPVYAKYTLKSKLINYEDENIFSFIRFNNNNIIIDDYIKNFINYEEIKYLKHFYKTQIKMFLNKKIKEILLPIIEKYNLNSDYDIDTIKVLKDIYRFEDFDKKLLLKKKELNKLVKDKLIKYKKEKDIYVMTRKGNNFLLEFNSDFWINKGINIVDNINVNFYKNYKQMEYFIMDKLFKLLKAEKEFINYEDNF